MVNERETEMTFNLTMLAGNQALITGDKSKQRCVLDASQWIQIKQHQQLIEAEEVFDASVEEFYKPLTEAAESYESMLGQIVKADPVFEYVLQPGAEGTEKTSREVYYLDNASAILRMIESGNTDRLIWVNDQILVTAL